MENIDRIFIASSGGFTQSRVSVLCDHETPSRRQGGVGMAIKLDAADRARPCSMSRSRQALGNSVAFDLTPIRHEFLSRVAEGALPASFSNECLEDLLAFKAKLLRKAEIVRKAGFAGDDDEAGGEDCRADAQFHRHRARRPRLHSPRDREGPGMSEIFKRPEIKSVDFCVDENIWGHRLYDEQLPHLTVLEFLGVLGSNLDKPTAPPRGTRRGLQVPAAAPDPPARPALQQPLRRIHPRERAARRGEVAAVVRAL
ncbi:MAG: hypothetical protein V9G29_15385 [Burkholderiaceae bacterium]